MRPGDVDSCADRLHGAGWSIGEIGCGAAWLVSGVNGENAIRTAGPIRAAAWRRACDQASAVGMLGRTLPRGECR
jgi:hypothetical protein